MDQCVHKIEQQLRRYKEKVQNHKGDVAHGRTHLAVAGRSRASGAGVT